MSLRLLIAAASAALAIAGPARSAPEAYVLDPRHSQIVFSYTHLGYSTNWGMFSGFSGSIVFDPEDPAASSVSVSFPVRSMLTGWQERFEQFMSADFFDAGEDEQVRFVSTGIEVTGDSTGLISGDLTLNGVTREVVLEAELNEAGVHPLERRPWAGFSATTTLLRSDFDLGNLVPFISDAVEVMISIEAMQVR